jgi:CrcB protein
MTNPSGRTPDEVDPETTHPDTTPVRAALPASPSPDWSVLAAVAIGGALGALARWAAGTWWPTRPGSFPWTTFGINVVGCALIGALMVLVTDVYSKQRLLRPFVVTGILGGFTTFSTYSVDTLRLVDTGHWLTAGVNVVGTLVAALAAVTVLTRLTRRAVTAASRYPPRSSFWAR